MKDGKNVVLKPKILSASVSRIVENWTRDDDSHFQDPEDRKRNLPHEGKSLLAGLIVALIGIGLVSLLTQSNPLDGGTLTYNSLILYGASIGAGILSWLAVQIIFLYKEIKHMEYVITPSSVEIKDNFWDQERTSASFEEVTDVELEKPILQRLFGTGNVLVNTAGSEGREIKMEFIKNPEVVQDEVSDMVSKTEYSQPK